MCKPTKESNNIDLSLNLVCVYLYILLIVSKQQTMDKKRCICQFVKWQMHPFIPKVSIVNLLLQRSSSCLKLQILHF